MHKLTILFAQNRSLSEIVENFLLQNPFDQNGYLNFIYTADIVQGLYPCAPRFPIFELPSHWVVSLLTPPQIAIHHHNRIKKSSSHRVL